MSATSWNHNCIMFVISTTELASNGRKGNDTYLLQEVYEVDVWLVVEHEDVYSHDMPFPRNVLRANGNISFSSKPLIDRKHILIPHRSPRW